MTSKPTPTTPANVRALRADLDAVSMEAHRFATNTLRTAVRFIAAQVRLTFPQAQRVELKGSKRGDWLVPVSIDGDEAKIEIFEDDLYWAAACIYASYRVAAPALHEVHDYPRHPASDLYIDIEQALNDK